MSKLDALPPTISVEQAGELLGVSRRAAYRAVHRGDIPSLHVGRRLLVPTAQLLELLGLDERPRVTVDTTLLDALAEPQYAQTVARRSARPTRADSLNT